MTTLAIVGCGQRKRLGDGSHPARDLYVGTLFVAARRHVEAQGLPWQILSGKHGLIRPDQIIAPYDFSLAEKFAELDRLDILTNSGGEHRQRWVHIQGGRLGHWVTGLGWRPGDGPRPDGGPVTIEVHAGARYADLVRECVAGWEGAHPRSNPEITVVEPLAGLELGARLHWYAEKRAAVAA